MKTKQVRAYNVLVGDELDWFDSQAKEVAVMVVKQVETLFDESVGHYVKMRVGYKDKKDSESIAYRCPENQLVRVRRDK